MNFIDAPAPGGQVSEHTGLRAGRVDPARHAETLWNLIVEAGSQRRDQPAILAPGKNIISYQGLAQTLRGTFRFFRNAGIGSRDRVAIVLPNGPEMAVAALAAMTAAVAAPLNPRYSGEEFDFYLSDLETRALLVEAGEDNPSRMIAKARGIPIIELLPDSREEGGLFRLDFPVIGPPSDNPTPGPDDIALLLHTSGTTSRPKLVPLTQSNLCCSARNIRGHLSLTPEDRCLNVMPLFHVHGLVASLLATLTSGGSLVCTRGFTANEFFRWIAEFHPTWYTAVPTIHQAVLAYARKLQRQPEFHELRFIRSCSSSLPSPVMSDLEGFFRVPVVEAYGMTEASHQISCNPLPPGRRKPGLVGVPTGPEIAILDEAENHLPVGAEGEIAIRGRTVTSGYLKNPEANAKAFARGWLRTGDIGRIDEDGYLQLSGRSKEMINRGGEKIAPRELEDVLLAHPAIAQAAAFAMPDDRLGEDVAAAIVLKPGAIIDEAGVRQFVAERLAYFKVPKRVVTVLEIPKGPTGKPQRIGLAQRLGMIAQVGERIDSERSGSHFSTGDSSTERRILAGIRRILGQETFGADDGFFEAGGDSMQAATLLTDLKKTCGVDIPIASFMIHPTAKYLAGIIDGKVQPAAVALVPIKKTGGQPPFFCVHPHDGRVNLFFPLAEFLSEDQPFYAFQAVSGEDLRPTSGGIERMARKYVAELKSFPAEGPYRIGGYCFGALVAFEMARLLWEEGEKVAFLALIDSFSPAGTALRSRRRFPGLFYTFLDQARRTRPLLAYLSHLPVERRREHVARLLRGQIAASRSSRNGAPPSFDALPGRENDRDWRYRPCPYPGSAVLFRPGSTPLGFLCDSSMGWDRYIKGTLEVEQMRGYHRSLIFNPCRQRLAERLSRRLMRCRK